MKKTSNKTEKNELKFHENTKIRKYEHAYTYDEKKTKQQQYPSSCNISNTVSIYFNSRFFVLDEQKNGTCVYTGVLAFPEVCRYS